MAETVQFKAHRSFIVNGKPTASGSVVSVSPEDAIWLQGAGYGVQVSPFVYGAEGQRGAWTDDPGKGLSYPKAGA